MRNVSALRRSPRALACAFALAGGGACIVAAPEAPSTPASTAAEELRAANVINVPVTLHIYVSTATPRGSAYVDERGREITYRDFDAAIEAFNAAVANPRGGPVAGRKLRLIRASRLNYPGGQNPLEGAAALPRVSQTLNVIAGSFATSQVTGARSANTAVVHPTTFAHDVAAMLGLHELSRQSAAGAAGDSADAAWVELLARDRNPASPTSCYRRGDAACDTVPDYGGAIVNADGTFDRSPDRCATLLAGVNLCDQPSRIGCDPADLFVDTVARTDGTGSLCAAALVGVTRHYDPVGLGNIVNRRGNVMGAGVRSWFTREQVTRMMDDAMWRMGHAEAIPASERGWVRDLRFAPRADALWDVIPDRTQALTNAQETEITVMEGSVALAEEFQDFSVPVSRGSARRVLARELLLDVPGGALPLYAQAQVGNGRAGEGFYRQDLLHDGSSFFGEHVFSSSVVPRERAPTIWTVSLFGGMQSAGEIVTRARLRVVTGDRVPAHNDRDGRGMGDILVRRGASLWTSSNAADPAAPTFGAGATLATQRPLLDTQEVVVGDFDGDDRTDLALFDRAQPDARPQIAFARSGYSTWVSTPTMPSYARVYGPGGEVLAGDIDKDGFADLVVRHPVGESGTYWSVHRGVGDGNFGPSEPIFIDHCVTSAAVGACVLNTHGSAPKWTIGDFNGDGADDILFRYPDTGRLGFVRGTSYEWVEPSLYGVALVRAAGPSGSWSGLGIGESDALLALDVDGDGRDEIVTRQRGTGLWLVSTQDETGAWRPLAPMSVGGAPSAYLDSDTVLGASR